MMSFRRTISVAALACLAAAAAGCGSAASGSSTGAPTSAGASSDASTPAALPAGQKATGTPLKVGYINLQGGATESLTETTVGTELAVSYVNGYLNGFGGHPVQLIKCYTDGTPASATACANQLVSDKVPLVIQGLNTDTAADPILSKAGIPFVLSSGSGPADLDTLGVFSLTTQSTGALAGVAAYAKDRGWKKVALLAIDVPNVTQLVQRFAGPIYGKAGVHYQVTYVAPGAPDETPQVSAAMSGHPDALYFFGDVNTCTSFLKAVGALGVTVPVLLAGSCADKAVLALAPATVLENTYILSSTDLGDAGADSSTLETFLRQQDPNADPHSVDLRLGYQSVVTLARMLKGFTGDPTAANLMKAIQSAKDVPLSLGRGAIVTCDGTAIPQLPSLCSPDTVLLKVQGDDKFAFANVLNLAPLFAP